MSAPLLGSLPMELPPWPALAAALPWVVTPAVAAWRLLDSTPLPRGELPPLAPGETPPLVSVVVPARNEARNIERLVRSVLASDWPALELIVVDDHSTDGTGALAQTAGHGDPRLRVIEPPPLPDGWFGKQWACHAGAAEARGAFLLFADADTWHAPDLAGRMLTTQRDTGAALVSVAGTQEMETFWERVVLPLPFFFLLLRFGGLNAVERATDPRHVIANGQCLLMSRAAYDAVGGHARVRDTAAEDLRLAQAVVADGGRVVVRLALESQRTRMYRSLGALVAGWAKNLYAGGKHFLPRWTWPLYRVSLVAGPLTLLLPLVALLAALAEAVPAWLGQAGIIALTSQTIWAGVMYAALGLPTWLALCHPLGAAVMTGIGAIAAWRGDRVQWSGRRYTAR